MTFFIKTYGCSANEADAERIRSKLKQQGLIETKEIEKADRVIIVSCVVRQSAENRVYGLIRKLEKQKEKTGKPREIILSGCLSGLLQHHQKNLPKRIGKQLSSVDACSPISLIDFETPPQREKSSTAKIPISQGCNNFCSYCIVPFSRGKEISRDFQEIIQECQKARNSGFKEILLIGQNVNSYGADLVQQGKFKGKGKPVMVKHLGKERIPTLFPHLLQETAQIGFEKINFISANPWDFSQKLIEVIAKNSCINRTIHLPVQSGDNEILKKMNRWYTREEYLHLIQEIRQKVPEAEFTTDIIVGFPGETESQFQQTVDLCRQVNFQKAFISIYSPRPLTLAEKTMEDNVPFCIKKKRRRILDKLINPPHW